MFEKSFKKSKLYESMINQINIVNKQQLNKKCYFSRVKLLPQLFEIYK